jgi:hypothetical protein
MQKYIPELLSEINEDPSKLKLYAGDAALNYVFKHAFDPSLKFILPEGNPPYKKDSAPIGMTSAILKQELKRFYVFCRADISPIRRETLFIQLLESVHPSEAEVLLAIKDQKLHKMYKKITHKLVAEAGFQVPPVPEKPKKEKELKKEEEPKKEIGATEDL